MLFDFFKSSRRKSSITIVPPKSAKVATPEDRGEIWAIDGLNFEKYIITRFSREANRLLDWRGDKFIPGYGGPESSGDPDVLFMTRSGKDRFAIECKYRSKWWYSPGHGQCIEWAREDQLNRYYGFQTRRGIQVYVAIGVGGSASDPAELFIARLNDIKYRIARRYHLEQFRKALPIPEGGLEFA